MYNRVKKMALLNNIVDFDSFKLYGHFTRMSQKSGLSTQYFINKTKKIKPLTKGGYNLRSYFSCIVEGASVNFRFN